MEGYEGRDGGDGGNEDLGGNEGLGGTGGGIQNKSQDLQVARQSCMDCVQSADLEVLSDEVMEVYVRRRDRR